MKLPQYLSLETIDFQNDGFGEKMEAMIRKLYDIIDADKIDPESMKDMNDLPEGGELANLIFQRLGLKVDFEFNTYTAGAVMPFFANENHIFLDEQWRIGLDMIGLPDQKKLLKTMYNSTGTIDLKNARLGGSFSKYTHPVYISLVYNKLDDLTPAENTAILLHEFGHAFTYYEYSNRTDTANQILSQLVAEFNNSKDSSKKDYLIKELGKQYNTSTKDVDDMLNTDNPSVLGMKIFRQYMKHVQSITPNAMYNQTSSEQLADSFASRFGYGRELITGLDRWYKGTPERNKEEGNLDYIRGIFIGILSFIIIIGGLIAGGPMVLVSLLMLLIWFVIYSASGDVDKDWTYDDLKIRYTRIKHQYIERIKNLKVPKEILNKTIADIKAMDKIIDKSYIYRGPLDSLKNALSLRNREAKKDIELQQLLEELAHNTLFLKSAELNNL